MTDPRKQRFATYLRRLADLLALKDWAVNISDEPPGEDHNASIWTTYGRRVATISLSEHFLDRKPEEQRHTLVHELLHCHLDPAWEIAREAMSPDTWRAWRRMGEHAIDGIADGIASLMPLPDEKPA